MGSIASTLYSINSSLLNEISNSLSPTQVSSSSSASSAASSATGPASDSVDFSQIAQLFQQLQNLQTTNPTEFKKVTADAASQLEDAAKQSTDPNQATFLSNLASKFQEASQSGNLSAFEGNNSTNSTSGHHGHHHHHGGSSTEDGGSTQGGDLTSVGGVGTPSSQASSTGS